MQALNSKYPSKIAFITGAASGLGAAFATLLSRHDWTLFLSDINLDTLEIFKTKLDNPDKAFVYQLDVSNKLAYEKLSDEISKKTDHIDVLINNAGIGDGELFQNYQMDHWERMIKINLLGTYYGCHYLLPLLEKEKGMIINIGSAAGFMNAPGMSAYNVSKAGVYALSETLYHEFKPRGIHVSVATPTFFKTNIMSDAAGSEKFVHFAQKQMKYSTTNADQMAETILEKSAKGEFQIIHPKEAKRSYFFKKWFPGLVEKQFKKLIKKFGEK